ncbi:18331_t:CDS:2 [Funneliformis geosporum]|nr:18331_t:CDS:2 [Funneliformis geosporum]
MANYNPTGFMPGGIRMGVPFVYSLPNGPRLPPTRPHLTMTPNGYVPGVHHNINANSYVPNMIMSNNPRNLIPMRIPTLPTKISCIVRLLSFAEFLGCDNPQGPRDDIQFWKTLAHNYFTEEITMKYTLHNIKNHDKKKYELKYHIIPRFYLTFYESGIEKIQIILGNPKETTSAPNGTSNSIQTIIDCTSASIVYHFRNGAQFTEYVPRHHQISKEATVNDYGIPFKTMRCLDIAEVVDNMHEVMKNAIFNPQLGPLRMMSASSQTMNLTPTISNNPNQNHRISNPQLNGLKDIKHEYTGAPPTPNANDLQASAPTPTANPTPNPTPTPTPTLTPSPLVSNPNGILIGSPHQKLSKKSPALSDLNLKRSNDNGSAASKKRRSTQLKTSPRKNA